MTELIIDNKKYVVIPEKNFQEIQKSAALKWKPEKLFSIAEARAYSNKRILKLASEK